MAGARWIAMFAVCLMAYQATYAQTRVLRTRDEIDALIHPTLSTTAERAVCGENVTVGEIDGAQSVTAHFTLRNTTERSIAISEFRTLCNCLRVTTAPRSLQAGESMSIEAQFDPMGRVGEFEHPIYVYTSLDEHNPTECLMLYGEVTTADSFAHLRYRMGELRLSRTTVTLDGVKVGATRSERIMVANSGNSDITLGATTTIKGLEFNATPTTLRPGEEGEITISYTPEELPTYDIETVIVVEGCEARPTERMIKITINR